MPLGALTPDATTRDSISLRDPPTFSSSLRFPIQSPESRRDLVVGALWLLVPFFGWLMNMGHRIRVVHRMHRGEAPWPAWDEPRELLWHGALTFLGMVYYGWPGASLMLAGGFWHQPVIVALGFAAWLLAVIAIPGYMSHYCRDYDAREIFDPLRALGRVAQGGRAYWRAWSIVVPAMLLSFVGLLGFGVGFLFTSVWFWQSAAFSFASVFTRRFDLDAR